MKHIEHNPYRYLGVHSNSPTKERVSNQTKMNAFLKVGRQVSFPLGMSDLLGPINRTSENVADAIAKLTLPADQIKHAQFWWMKVTPMDDIAFNHLTNGNLEMAKSIWEKKEDTSSLQNRIVLSLVYSDYASAIGYAQTLYNNYAPSFVSNIVEAGASLDGTALAHNFIDALIEESFDISQLQNLISDNEWIAYLSEKTIAPLIDSITQAIAIAQVSKGKGPKARYEAGLKLMESTKNSLNQLKSFISVTDIRYGTVADKLGIEILQCGIDYYNDSEENDRAQKAQRMMLVAQSIVVGNLAKERCKENEDIMKKIISELPPIEVMTEYNAIIYHLEKFLLGPKLCSSSNSVLSKTESYLQSVKKKLGKNSEAYLKLSTMVVNCALKNVFECVESTKNKKAKLDVWRLNMQFTLKSAWSAIMHADTFDMETEFRKKRFNPCVKYISSMCKSFGILTPCSSKKMKKLVQNYPHKKRKSIGIDLSFVLHLFLYYLYRFGLPVIVIGLIFLFFADDKKEVIECVGAILIIGFGLALVGVTIGIIVGGIRSKFDS